ncbi:MAG: inositol phosphate phosphatase SopB [Endozoicomonas sp.]
MFELPGQGPRVSGAYERSESGSATKELPPSSGHWKGRGVGIGPLLEDPAHQTGEDLKRAIGRRYGTFIQGRVSSNLSAVKKLSDYRIRIVDGKARSMLHKVRKANAENVQKWLKEGLLVREFEAVSGLRWQMIPAHEKRHMLDGVRAELAQSKDTLNLNQAGYLVGRYLEGRNLEGHRTLFSHSSPRTADFLEQYAEFDPPVLSGHLAIWAEHCHHQLLPGEEGHISRYDLALARNVSCYSHRSAILLSGSPLEKLSEKSFRIQIDEARQHRRDLVKTIRDINRYAKALPDELKQAMLEDLVDQCSHVNGHITQLEVMRDNSPLRRENWKKFKLNELAAAIDVVHSRSRVLLEKEKKEGLSVKEDRRLDQLTRLLVELDNHADLVLKGLDGDIPPGLVKKAGEGFPGFEHQPLNTAKAYARAVEKRLVDAGVFHDPSRESAPRLAVQVKQARKSLKIARSERMSRLEWSQIRKSLNVRIDGQLRNYNSRITPASQLQMHTGDEAGTEDIFPVHYAGRGRPSTATRERVHAVNLAETEISSQRGRKRQRLFRGLRSATLSAYGISNGRDRKEATRARARELVTAALRVQLERHPEYLETVTPIPMKMFSTSLLTPDRFRHETHIHDDELTMQREQVEALEEVQRELAAGGTLKIVNSQGRLHEVPVQLDLIGTNYGVNSISLDKGKRNLMRAWGAAERSNHTALNTLMGSSRPGAIVGGWVKDYLDGPVTEEDRDIVLTLVEQIRDLHTTGDYREEGEDAYKMVERLQLLAFRIGAVPHFNCKSGKDRTGEADAGIKRLAAETEALGYVPDPRQPVGQEERSLSQAFLFGTGNIELQQQNINLPGYKTKTGRDRLGDKVYQMVHHPEFDSADDEDIDFDTDLE